MPSNYKNLVRARMAKTGESWQTAVRAVREKAAGETRPPTESGDEECLGESRCPLASWNGQGPRPNCGCLGIDMSLPLLDGDDY